MAESWPTSMVVPPFVMMIREPTNSTKIIIAQRVACVQDADLILVMDNGHIADMGTHDQLLASSEIYREVYESQTNGGEQDEA